MANGTKPAGDATAPPAKSDAARTQAAAEVKAIVSELKELALNDKTSQGKVEWFPHGITLLRVSASAGVGVKGVTFEVQVQGPDKPPDKPGTSEPQPKPALPA